MQSETSLISSFLQANEANVIDMIITKLKIAANPEAVLFAPTDNVFVALLKALNVSKAEFMKLPTVKDIVANHIINGAGNTSLSGQEIFFDENSVGLDGDNMDIPIVNAELFENDVTVNIIEGILITERQRLLLDEDIVRLIGREGENSRLKPYALKYGVESGFLGRYSASRIIDRMNQFTSGGNSSVQQLGILPDVFLQQNFDVSKYMGTWYNAARYPQPFDMNTPWETAEYHSCRDLKLLKQKSQIDCSSPNKIEVKNTAYNEDNSVRGQIIGSAEVFDPNMKSKLYVSFPTGQPRPQNPIPNYLIHATDYDDYSIVGSYDKSNLYILVRQRPITRSHYNELLKLVKSFGYDTSKLQQDYGAVI